jgi:hypoxanthine phosphoribosyltransferase
MSEDAFNGKKILVIDDINDTGETLNYLCQDWQRNCIPDDIKWDTVWDDNVRFATLTENMASGFGNVRYYSHEINKAEEDVWLVYPWESQV